MKKIMLVIFLFLFAFQCAKRQQTLEHQLAVIADTTAAASDSNQYSPPEIGMEQKAASALQTLYFEFDSYLLSEQNRDRLAAIGAFMKEYPEARLVIEGHCDERGSAEYNMALGQRRADAAKIYLADFGIEPERVTTISWGEERPSIHNVGEEAWAKNRRDEFRLEKSPVSSGQL